MSDARLPLLVLVATMTGTAEVLAEDLEAQFGEQVDARLQLLEETEIESLEGERFALIVSSTYGTGDVPETAAPAWQALQEQRADLSGLTYGVISLGDSSYVDTFAQGGEKWDRALAACGASRLGEILKLDCQDAGEPLEPAKQWLTQWLSRLAEESEASGGRAAQGGSR